MAEEASDVKNMGEVDTSTTDSSTATTNNDGGISLWGDDQLTKQSENNSSETGTQAENGESREKENSPETKSDPPRKNAETRKQQLNNEIRDRIAERNALRKEIAELTRQKSQTKTTSDLPTVEALMDQVNPETGDYYTRIEAKFARLEAERELEREQHKIDEYTENVVDSRLQLRDEASRALRDFPIFDEQSSSFNKLLTERADKIANSLIERDSETGEVVGVKGSVYEVYAAIAAAVQAAETDGKIAGRQAALKMANSADVVEGATGSTAAEDDDPFLKGLKRAGN